METIKNYLDAMFATLPNSEAVLKAKSELLEMMEDKYNELISEGNTENAAVGTVIAEFGNLDELAEDLGIKSEMDSDTAKEMADRRLITMDEAKEYIQAEKKSGAYIAIGVFLCIACVVGPIFSDVLSVNDGIGVVVMFSMIAAAVGLFIYNGTSFTKWKFVKNTPCRIDVQTANYLVEEKSKCEKAYAICMAIGVILCSFCWLPAAVLDSMSYISTDDLAGALLFIILALGVALIIKANSMNKSYETLLNLNNKDCVSGNFDRHETVWICDQVKLVMELFWPAVTSIYLIWSFLTFKFWATWVVWPIAALIHFVLKKLLSQKN